MRVIPKIDLFPNQIGLCLDDVPLGIGEKFHRRDNALARLETDKCDDLTGRNLLKGVLLKEPVLCSS